MAYIVTKQLFFNHKGTDIGEGIDTANLRLFSSLYKAERYVAEKIKEYKDFSDEDKFERYVEEKSQWRPMSISYSQSKYNSNGIRKTFRIVKLTKE